MRIDATTQMTKPMAIRGRDCVANRMTHPAAPAKNPDKASLSL